MKINFKKKYKNFSKIFNSISKLNSFHKEKLITSPYLKSKDYLVFCDLVSSIILNYLKKKKLNFIEIAKAYDHLCSETLVEQFIFKKKGEYNSIDKKKNNTNLYNSKKKMNVYMLGLLVSQMFWSSHYKIMSWYLKKIQNLKIKNFFEIGPGHGLLSYLASKFKGLKNVTLCDMSPFSIDFTKDVLSEYDNEISINYLIKDFTKPIKIKKKFDFIVLGEVIEHVYNPKKILNNVKKISDKKTIIFLSTCANCPAEDHLYRFKDIIEIRKFLKSSNFIILDELISPSEDIPKKLWKKEKIAINYCCFLKKK